MFGFTCFTALLMVSTVPFRGFKSFRLSRGMILNVAVVLASVLVVSVRYNLSTAFLAIGLIYIASGPLELIVRRLVMRQEWVHAAVRNGMPSRHGGVMSLDEDEDREEDLI